MDAGGRDFEGAEGAYGDAMLRSAIAISETEGLGCGVSVMLEALALEPRDGTLLMTCSGLAWSADRFDVAVMLSARAAEQAPHDPDVLMGHGHALFAAGQFESAIDSYERAALRPDLTPRALSCVVESRLSLGQYELAIDAARRAELACGGDLTAAWEVGDWLSGSAGKIIERADLQLEAGNVGRALRLGRYASELAPDCAAIQHGYGRIAREAGDYAVARQAFEAAATLDAGAREPWFSLGNVHRSLGSPADSLRFYEKALAVDPEYVDAMNNMSLSLNELGRFAEAEALLRRAIQISPDDGCLRLNLGESLLGLDRPDLAVEEFRLALGAAPDLLGRYDSLAEALELAGRDEEAHQVRRDADDAERRLEGPPSGL